MPPLSLTHPGEPAPSPAVRPGFVLAAFAALVVLTSLHPSSSRMLAWPWVLVTATLWLLPVVALLWRLFGPDRLHCPNRAVTAGLVLLALATVAAAVLSPFSAASLVRTWPTLAGVAWCFLLHDALAARRVAATPLARLVASGAIAVVVVSLVRWIDVAALALGRDRNAFPFGHSVYTAGFVVLVLPWLVERAWSSVGKQRLGWIVANAAAVGTLVSTSSRGGVIAVMAVGGGATLLALFRAPWSRARKLALVAALVACGAGLVLVNPRLRELVTRWSWSDSAQESNRQRTAMLEAGRLLGAERPVLGWGPGTVPLIYPRVRAQLDGGVDNALQLHSTPLQIWATLGTAGALASLVLLGGAALALRRASPERTTLAAAASIGGYAVFCLMDHQLDLPAFTTIVALDLAVITAAAHRAAPGPKGSRVLRVVALAGLVVVALPAWELGRDLRARWIYDNALGAFAAGRPDEALAALDAATRLTPHDPYFQHRAASHLIVARDTLADPVRVAGLTRDAIARLEASLATGVHLEFAHFNLGWLHLDAGNPGAAARHFHAVIRLVPDKGGVYFGLGLALQALGRRADALRAFALEWINDPRSSIATPWEVPALAALRPEIRAEMLRLYPGLVAEYPRAAAALAWTRWWQGEPIPPADLGRGLTEPCTTFAALLPTFKERQPVPGGQRWMELYACWRQRDFPVPHIAATPSIAAALVRRAQRHGDDFGAFLRAGTENEDVLMQTYRRTRPGYGVLALHPDGPPLADAYIVQEIGIVAHFAAELFPPKGWLPGRFLLALLPPDPR